jgi:hypothetical protein
MYSSLKNFYLLFPFSLLFVSNVSIGASSCEGVSLERDYQVVGRCQLGDKFLANGSTIQLSKQGDTKNCSFTAYTTVTETRTEYSITPPPGVIVGPYDKCALWAFDEGSRPGSFPKDMVEPCRIWRNRPPDRVITNTIDVNERLISNSVRLDISKRVSNISTCQVR